MVLMHPKVGLADLSRQLMRLSLLSKNQATCIDLVNSTSSGSLSAFYPRCLTSSCHQIPQTTVLGLGGIRSYYRNKPNMRVTRKKYKDDKNAIYCHGFTYYPRFPNHKDPPIEPTKLFMVKRIRSLYGCPWWEKEWITQLHLDDRGAVGIFKNTPTMNALLHRVKHLIEIKPITMPYGLPDKAENGFLKESGELISYNPLKLHGEDVNVEDAEKELTKYRDTIPNRDILKTRLTERWNSKLDII